MIVTPEYISFDQWSRSLFIDLPGLNIPQPISEELWKDWGNRLIEENDLVLVPITNNYENWQKWAVDFVKTVYN